MMQDVKILLLWQIHYAGKSERKDRAAAMWMDSVNTADVHIFWKPKGPDWGQIILEEFLVFIKMNINLMVHNQSTDVRC